MEPSSSAAASLSLVYRAKTVLHSAAAKVERVFTDIKADLKSDRDRDGQAQRETRKSTDREMVVSDVSNELKEEEGPVLTEELIKEAEELVLRTGSVGAGCSQLLSDMQDFKAANSGCVLEDFVRWHSPPDWTSDDRDDDSLDGEGSSKCGWLSRRMQKECT